MAAEKNIPEIRFKGFEGEWEDVKLTDIYNFQYGYFNNNPSDGGQYPVYGANGIIGKYSKYNAESSVVIGHMGEYAGSVIWAEGKHFVTYNGTISTVKNDRINSKFGFYLLSKLNINKICGGSGQPFLSYDTLEKIQSYISTSIPEQTQLGTYFQNLDSLISLHQRKYDKLLTVKKAMLEKMFPKEGADVPEIRFKGFEGKWEKKKLGEIGEQTFGGGTPQTSNNDFWNGSIPWFQSSDLSEDDLLNVIINKKITNKGLSNSATKLVPANSIAIITRVGVGKLALIPFEYTTSQDFLSISHLKANPHFTVYACYKKIQSELHAVQGTSIKGITKEELLSKSILIPTEKDEQAKIGTFFQNLDTQISQNHKQLEKLKNVKKACLEKMFV